MFTKLTNTKSDESHFLVIENIFFEVIGIARIYGNDINDNKFLADLKGLKPMIIDWYRIEDSPGKTGKQ